MTFDSPQEVSPAGGDRESDTGLGCVAERDCNRPVNKSWLKPKLYHGNPFKHGTIQGLVCYVRTYIRTYIAHGTHSMCKYYQVLWQLQCSVLLVTYSTATVYSKPTTKYVHRSRGNSPNLLCGSPSTVVASASLSL